MFSDIFLENQIISSIEKAKKDTILKLEYSHGKPQEILKNFIQDNFEILNSPHNHVFQKRSLMYIDTVELFEVTIDHVTDSPYKSVIGSAMVIAGQPILKKRFVMVGSSIGTSIASKYLAQTLPQTLPFRFLGTKVLGRLVGRIVPYVGWTLLAIDVVEIIIEYSEHNNENNFSFGGGSFGGGGASGKF
jgi:hypothetical protein